MKYVKIKANTYSEAMMKLKSEHGDDAIPISHKYVKEGGFLNSRFFSKQVVELTAGIKERTRSSKSITGKSKIDITVGKSRSLTKQDLKKKDDQYTDSLNSRDINIDSLNKTIDALNSNLNGLKGSGKKTENYPPGNNLFPSGMIGEDLNINKNVTQTPPVTDTFNFEKINKTAAAGDALTRENISETAYIGNDTSSGETLYRDDVHLKKFDDMLKDNDFDEQYRREILNKVKNSVSRNDMRDRFKIEKSFTDLIKSKIVTTGPIKTNGKKKILMFIGPTGVGKTTTMAKLGAIYSLRERSKVIFITIDNYRIAATEQLKKYAEIMRIPVHAVNDPANFSEIIAGEKADIIMVDTSGRSHRNELKINEIKNFAGQIDFEFETILCVSANIKKVDLNEIFRAFDIMDFSSIIITKVDETSFIGNVVDIADKYSKPISYYTNGQEVPNDIVAADSENIVKMMFRDLNI